MNTDEHRYELDELTERIIGCAYQVSNGLGCGFLEKPYENALVHELRKAGLACEPQKKLDVHYDGIVVGEYFADIVVDGRILVELKATQGLDRTHFAQCLNYLKPTGMAICLLLNFGTPRIQIKRTRL